MNKTRRERIILGLLMAVLAFAGWRLWGSFEGAPVVSTAPGGVEASSGVDTGQLPSFDISAGWADGIREGDAGAGRNPFEYGAVPPAPRPAPPPLPPADTFVPPAQPAPQPAPAPLPIRYVGYSRIGGPTADLRAVLIVEGNPPMPVLAGETVLGRYRVQEVAREFAVVEDLQSGRRERLAVDLPD